MKKYGICHRAYVPVRKEPSHASEMVSQLILGELYSIVEQSSCGEWYLILAHVDEYLGWIHKRNYSEISEQLFQEHLQGIRFCNPHLQIVAKTVSEFRIIAPLGSFFYKIHNNAHLQVGNMQFKVPVEHQFKKADIIRTSKRLIGVPYLWGGKTVWGFDCSGFVQILYRTQGIFLPRDAWQQAQKGISIEFAMRQKGDLAFFTNDAGKVVHVGFLANRKQIFHASGEVRIDSYDSCGIWSASENCYTHRGIFLKRVL
ncbi:MAG: C40 family peptidase [Cytophagales bacterium]|nr:C40 family peptidase [Cytophagales bacterium]MDW8384160.1 C40 family peptidase [Flammeovirgaceae bacterium]